MEQDFLLLRHHGSNSTLTYTKYRISIKAVPGAEPEITLDVDPLLISGHYSLLEARRTKNAMTNVQYWRVVLIPLLDIVGNEGRVITSSLWNSKFAEFADSEVGFFVVEVGEEGLQKLLGAS